MATKVVEVHPGIYEIFLPLPMRPTIINVYLIDCHGAWALIDTGMNSPESTQALDEAFAEIGIKVEDLDFLVGTHHHIDHFGASGEIRHRSHAKTHIHRLEAERAGRMIEFGRMSPGERPESRAFFATHGFPIEQFSPTGMRPMWMGTGMYKPVTDPDQYIDDGDVLKIGDRELEVIWTPGHSPGHNVIYLRKEKVMIVGDHLLPKITPHVGIYPDNAGGNPLGDFISSQLKVQKFDVELVLPAHGGVYHDHRHRANQLIEHHRYREAEMLDLTRKGAQTAFEVAQQVFGGEERPIFHVMAATFETLAHLELACIEGRARKFQRGERIVFQAL
ncbi:MAG TPA: MBL fold metallo-hydrolase [Candidatus Acidoferrales bacterium]|nr:MBL fold metallo-hydrolase [Candidatus Acidoferrales bacterium]